MKTVAIVAAVAAACTATTKLAGDALNPDATAATQGASVELVQGKGVTWWSRHAVQARKDANARARTIRRLRKVIRRDVTIQDAIDLAAVTYGVDAATLSRKASCESTGGHGYNPNAKNRNSTAAGLFQFLDSTWASTPYRRFSPYDPLAAALAAGWMHSASVGRGSEWSCR